jgi:hypothetical protein
MCCAAETAKAATDMETPKEYLAAIGAKGGKKSRRKLSKKEARRIALIGWEKRREAAARFREGMGR